MPPAVQDLNQIIADLNPAYAGQEGLINQQKSGLGIKYDSQRSALGAEKTQGFNQINNQATGRGLSFSGIPLDEQATYLSTKYLPGMQNLAQQQNQEDMSLQQQLAAIDSDRRLKAMDIRQGQQSSLEKFLADERTRQFQAEQSRLDRAAQASAAAMARADKKQENAPPTLQQAIIDGLTRLSGTEGFKSTKATEDLAGALATQYGVSKNDVLFSRNGTNGLYGLRKQNFGF